MTNKYIWQNSDINIDDWRDGYAEFCEINNIEPGNEDDFYQWIDETNAEYLHDERANLNKIIDSDIIAIADLGLWNRRVLAYKIIKSRNISDILYSSAPLVEWFADGRDICATETHHDGINYIIYRAIRPGRNIDQLTDAIINNKHITRAKLNYYTRSIYNDVADVYGWEKRGANA
jgi:hypothetical protein